MPDFVQKVSSLPQNLKSFVFSNIPMIELKKSFALFGINSAKSEKIAGEIGLMYVGDFRIGGLPKLIQQNVGADERVAFGISCEINKRIFNKFPEYFKDSSALLEEWGRMKSAPVLSEDESWKKVLELEPWIAELESEKKEEAQAEQNKVQEKMASVMKMTIQEALKKFEKLGEQHLSGNPIKLKIFEAPVRPSIKNWIADYYEKVDARHHDSIERGNYLFHSENARRLTTGERQKVGTMLRALDENAVVAVDPARQEIVFGVSEEEAETVARPNSGMADFAKRESAGATFSSPHKFPFERNEARNAPMARPAQRVSNNIVDLKNGSLD